MARVNRIWPTAVAGKADKELTLSASACHIGGPNSVNPGQILLVYGNGLFKRFIFIDLDLACGASDYNLVQKIAEKFPMNIPGSRTRLTFAMVIPNFTKENCVGL